MDNKKIFLGLDIGTDSVGYAVTDSDYELIKSHGDPMWGAHVFESANQCAERRSFRSGRRRLDRRQNRVKLLQELFAPEIGKKDADFFIRIKESALYREDTSTKDEYVFFNDKNYTDKDYHREYPTIHHLICELISNKAPHDVRLVYLACAWLVAHRGHFLSKIDSDNIDELLKFDNIYRDFTDYCSENFAEHELNLSGEALPWHVDAEKFAEVLKMQSGVKAKESAFYALLFNGKKPKKEEYPVDISSVIKLLSGGSVKPSAIFWGSTEYDELPSISLDMETEKYDELLPALGDDGDFILRLKDLYDWSILANFLSEGALISAKKVRDYEEHRDELAKFKAFVKKHCDVSVYREIFDSVDEKICNYVSYSYHYKTVSKTRVKDLSKLKKASKTEFCDYIRKKMKDVTPDDADRGFYDEMMSKLELGCFLPKQVDGDNRILPMQLYRYELKSILKNAENYLPFLSDRDESGTTVSDKIMSIFSYRIPYYVGPLGTQSDYSWIVRKGSGRIYPWNFDSVVDHDASERMFIKRMLSNCTYLDGENALPKNSLLYSSFTVLNSINNIKVNGREITPECKQFIYNEVFKRYASVTKKRIISALVNNNFMGKDDILTGVDDTVGATLKPWKCFESMLSRNIINERQAEQIIERLAYTEEESRIMLYLNKNFPDIPNEDKKYISRLKLKDFGRLSKKFLNGIIGTDKSTGETYTIIRALWETNYNLQQLLSDKFTFADEVERLQKEYYDANPMTLSRRMDDMYISNAVKRPIIRALDIVSDVRKTLGRDPDRIFVEVTRGASEEQKHKRTHSRREQITERFADIDSSEVRELSKQLDGLSDQELQSERYYLYFMQLGKCMYSGEKISIEKLKTDAYDVDHIYPRCRVKDDSLSNKVLVLKTYNGLKGDNYPVYESWRHNMYPFWSSLLSKKMISQEKFYRLTRSTPFSDEEKMGFINRQLVETSQASSAIAKLLKEMMPDTQVVYVKAGLVSDFRNQVINEVKCRSINDHHHAKDAYLNIVVGNVYYGKFTSRYFNIDAEDYSMKQETLFNQYISRNGEKFWSGGKQIAQVKRIVSGNAVHYTRYPFCKMGALFDQNPMKAGTNDMLYPRKKGLDPDKYGGYNRLKASCFSLVRVTTKKKTELLLIGIDVMCYGRFISDDVFAMEYIRKKAAEMLNKEPLEISFPLKRKTIKLHTMFSFDGFMTCLAGKTGGFRLKFYPCMNMLLPEKWQEYVHALDRFSEKNKKNSKYKIYPEYDKITVNENLELFDILSEKTTKRPYSVFFSDLGGSFIEKRGAFEKMSIEDQAIFLTRFVELFKSGRASNCDFSALSIKSNGTVIVSAKLKNWEGKFKDVRIIESSASGIYTSRSENILKLI